MTLRRFLVASCALVAAVVVVVVGRVQRASERNHNLDGIAFVRALVGGGIAKPDDYRVSPGLYCLLYSARRRVFALELCADRYGRLVEAVDRRGTLPVFYSVTAEPGVATEHIDMTLVNREIAKLSSPKG